MANLGSRLSRRRKIALVLLTAVLVIAGIEAGAALLLGLSEGRWPSLGEIAARRGAMLDAGGRTGLAIPASDRPGDAPETLHPYTGFTRAPTGAEVGDSRPENLALEPAPAFEERLFFEPSEGRVVIAVLGGSVADIVAAGGAGLAMELRKVDRFADQEISVISFAQGGFKQPQQLTLLAYLLALGAHFDLVLNIDGFNEVALPATELVPRGVFPFYPRGWDQRVSAFDSDARRVAADLSLKRQRRRDLALRFSGWPWRASHVAALLWHTLDHRAVSDIAAAELMLLEARSEHGYGSHGPRRGYDSPAEMYEDLARLWYQASLQISHLCRSQGLEYRHFLQPNQYLPASKPVGAERENGSWLPEHPYRLAVEQGYPWLIRFGRDLRARGVAFDDLTGIFASRDELLYVDSCCHLNYWGNTLLQRAIAHRLSGGSYERPENVSDGELALEGYDPVSYFDLEPVRGSPEVRARHDGLRYRFASAENRTRFLAAPERYIPRFGGWCAFGMGLDEDRMGVPRERFPVDPLSYEISGGRLYLFHRTRFVDGRELWRQDRERFRQRAAEAWQRLRRR